MDQLGSLDQQQLLRLVLASGACIVVLAVVMVAYVVLARRSRRARGSPPVEMQPAPPPATAAAGPQPPRGSIGTQLAGGSLQARLRVRPRPAPPASLPVQQCLPHHPTTEERMAVLPGEGTRQDALFSLVEEIDRIFQVRLAASPLSAVDAQLQAGPDGSVRVRVGTRYYDTPDQVPDRQLRDLIRQSIAEW